MAVLSCGCVRFCGTLFVLKNVVWDYHIVFIGVWGILVSELQVPSYIVFGDMMKYSSSFVYGQWTGAATPVVYPDWSSSIVVSAL